MDSLSGLRGPNALHSFLLKQLYESSDNSLGVDQATAARLTFKLGLSSLNDSDDSVTAEDALSYFLHIKSSVTEG